MKHFYALREEVNKEYKEELNKALERIKSDDNSLRYYLTDLKINQLKEGKITREKAEEFATKKIYKEHLKRYQKKLNQIMEAEEAQEVNNASIYIEWKRSNMWGMNPHAEMYADNNVNTYGKASGCGYDKLSSAVAECLNANKGIKKLLYALKDKTLLEGDKHFTEYGHPRDNRTLCGYGSGYGALPYFEGGVGVGCFQSIFNKMGYTFKVYDDKKNTKILIFKA